MPSMKDRIARRDNLWDEFYQLRQKSSFLKWAVGLLEEAGEKSAVDILLREYSLNGRRRTEILNELIDG